jgi:peroxiredoxin
MFGPNVLSSPAMLHRSLALLVFACYLPIAGEDIKTVNSWDEYRAMLKSQGKTDTEIDAQVAKMLAGLKTMDRAAGKDRIGVAPPPFQFEQWINSKPLALEDLRGNVVLLRWWTDTCPLCATTSPALRKLHEQYSARGLRIVGVFHPKAGRDTPLDVERVRRAVAARQLSFPVAIDWKWLTLRSWWLNGTATKRQATSVTFLLDKSGVIRFVHPGMEYHDAVGSKEHAACENDMVAIRAAIDRLISE